MSLGLFCLGQLPCKRRGAVIHVYAYAENFCHLRLGAGERDNGVHGPKKAEGVARMTSAGS